MSDRTQDVSASLPVDAVLPALRVALSQGTRAVLQAPPGAGKTTRVPPALLGASWLAGRRIIMLEPRRLATRAAARYMATQRGEAVGETVGYRVRLDSRVSSATRIEVVTERILTRMIQDDPTLEGVGCVIFDEFHERSLHADLGLALVLDAAAALREDLRIVVMSATLEGERVADLLGAPLITSEGRSWPVKMHYRPTGAFPGTTPRQRRAQCLAAVGVVREALVQASGSLLVFLPGEAEIRMLEQALRGVASEDATLQLIPLYGNLPQKEQDRAIRPSPVGCRKVVLATAIAETSLTIEGVCVVIDTGLRRAPRFDPRTGMTRLVTQPVSRASALQRSGRAGRLESGACYRLWSEDRQQTLLAHNAAEILEADLAPLVLELAAWGTSNPATLRWLDPPPEAAWRQAQTLLLRLGALCREADGQIRLSAHGRTLASLGMHPRLAHMIREGERLGVGALACELAALLSERDLFRRIAGQDREADLLGRVQALRRTEEEGGARVDRGAWHTLRDSARSWRRQRRLAPPPADGSDLALIGVLLGFAYPDRIALRRAGQHCGPLGQGGETVTRYKLANGRGARLNATDPLAREVCLVVAQLDAGDTEAQVYLGAALERADLEVHFAGLIETQTRIDWSSAEEAVLARQQRTLGTLVLDERALPDPDPVALMRAMLDGLRQLDLAVLPWTQSLRAWQARVQFIHTWRGALADQRADRSMEMNWPNVSDGALRNTLADWLGPFLGGITRRSQLANIDLKLALTRLLSGTQQHILDTLAPTHYTVPSGSRYAIDYRQQPPVLAVKLQEMFGATHTPRIAGGRVALVLHLLSPAGRALQVTQDLAGFWAGSYGEVKKEMKGRYPRHPWPDDPLNALPTRHSKRRVARRRK